MGIIRKWLNHQSICCCRKSTREIDLRHTIRAWPLTEVKVTEKMFEVGKYDLKMRSVTSLNGGKFFLFVSISLVDRISFAQSFAFLE